MPDGLYYPLSPILWTVNGLEEVDQSIKPLLECLEKMIRNGRRLRHELRQSGNTPSRGFNTSRRVLPILTGFHKNRIIDSGFEIISIQQWKSI